LGIKTYLVTADPPLIITNQEQAAKTIPFLVLVDI